MKRWIALAVALYPRSWRGQYGEEFGALLDDVKPGWRVLGNVLGGAIKMQLTTGTNWLRVVAATAAAGAIVAVVMSFAVAPHYVSSAVMSVAPQADPLRPLSPQALQQRAADRFAEMEMEILSRNSLAGIIQKPSLNLYRRERRRIPMGDVVEQMRRNIRIEARSSPDGGVMPIVFSVSFAYPDQVKAQAVVRELTSKFIEQNVTANRKRGLVYEAFWQDESAAHHAKPAPPPPVGEDVAVLDDASLAKETRGPNRIGFLAWGVGVGLVLGLLAALAMRRPRGAWQLGGFAAAGCALAVATSFLIPNQYISSAVMRITPAQITEDPLAAAPAVIPADEILRQMEPQILSQPSLSRIIQDPELNLYPGERARRPMEEVIRNMIAHDLRIAVLNPPSGTTGAASAFSISFSYSNKYKAQAVVHELVSAFTKRYLNTARSNASQVSVTLRNIHERRAGEHLEVIDPASLPELPVAPNRLAIAAAGLGIGLLLGTIRLCLRRPRTPALQPA